MNAAEIIDNALDAVARLGGNATYQGLAEIQLQLAQEVFEMGLEGPGLNISAFRPWFLLTERSSTQMTVGEPRVELPADFIEEYEGSHNNPDIDVFGGALQLLDTDGSTFIRALDKVSIGEQDFNSGNDIPRYYSLQGSYFRLSPAPKKAYYVRMIYYAKQTQLTYAGANENAWTRNAQSLLFNDLATRIAVFLLKDPDSASPFAQARDAAIAKIHNLHVSRMMQNQRLVMGGAIYGAHVQDS